jgi:hypothetical protein
MVSKHVYKYAVLEVKRPHIMRTACVRFLFIYEYCIVCMIYTVSFFANTDSGGRVGRFSRQVRLTHKA